MFRFAVPFVVVAAYAASPYLSLYEMGQAVRHGDVASVCADIDWDHVREGLKKDIADGITGQPAATEATATTAAKSDDLPPFGAGFMSNMAGNVVDRVVTPRHLAETLGALRAGGATMQQPALESAHFTSPTSFIVAVRPEGAEAVRLRLDLREAPGGLRWQVTRAWIPDSVLQKSETHTS